MSGFINLHDITEDQLMSWQLWRGNLGFDIYFYPSLKTSNHTLAVGILLHHKSQHVTDMFTFSEEFLRGGPFGGIFFDNASARSFEYAGIEVKDEYSIPNTRFSIYGMLNARIFSQPVLPDAIRQQTLAYASELGIHYKPFKNKKHFIYLQLFYEQVLNEFVGINSPYNSKWNKQPFIFNMYEAGIFLAHPENKNNISVFAGFNNSNGRGLDFIRQYQEMYGGVRFVL